MPSRPRFPDKDPRCPRCQALFTPAQLRVDSPAAECTFCQMVVLLPRLDVPDPSMQATAPVECLFTSEIAQLYVRCEKPKGPIIPRSWFVVYARDVNGKDHRVAPVNTPAQAWWLEEKLEEHLGIIDRRIDGEHAGPR